MSDDNTELMTFGRYKGQPILEVLAKDRSYFEWLSQKAWFKDKVEFKVINNVVNLSSDKNEDTPEHNAMQAEVFSLLKRTCPEFRVAVEWENIDIAILDRNRPIAILEIKPSIGDDYPSAIRQIDRYRRMIFARYRNLDDIDCVFIYGSFDVSNVSEYDVVDMFSSNNITAWRWESFKEHMLKRMEKPGDSA